MMLPLNTPPASDHFQDLTDYFCASLPPPNPFFYGLYFMQETNMEACEGFHFHTEVYYLNTQTFT